MPVSKNRRKKDNKQSNLKSKPVHQRILDKILGLDDCRKCEGLRDEFSFKELPDDQQLHWARSGIVNQINYFLYCPICNEYSAILEIEKL